MAPLYALLACIACLASVAAGSPFRYAEDRSPAIVNPLFATTMSEVRLDELVFEGLFTDDASLQSVPQLAASWSVAEDGKQMQIRLRQDVRWHDGRPFSSRDVVFTIQAMKDPGTGSPEAGLASWIADARATDDHTVVLDFENPEHAPQDKLHFKILPAHRFTSTTVSRTDPFRNAPVGTGPWLLRSYNDDNSITLARFPDYYDRAHLNEVVMREVSDKNYQAKLLIYGSLEALVRVLPRDLATLQNDRKIELYPYQTNSWWYVGFNLRDSRLQPSEVRQAVALLMNVPELLRPIGTGDRVSGPFVPSSPFYDHDVPLLQHDPARAKVLLEQAGYRLDGRAWTGPDGQPLRLKLATASELETAQDVVINLQSQLQTQGIQIEPHFLGTAQWKQQVWRDHTFDLVLSQWSFDRNEDVREQFHSDGSRNFLGYASDEVDRLLDEARDASDPHAKKAALRQVHRIVATDTPMVFLWTLHSYSAIARQVQGVVVHPFTFFTWARDWTIE